MLFKNSEAFFLIEGDEHSEKSDFYYYTGITFHPLFTANRKLVKHQDSLSEGQLGFCQPHVHVFLSVTCQP
jgi:hypothetical protein